MLPLFMALALMAPQPAKAPEAQGSTAARLEPHDVTITARTPEGPRLICKWRVHTSGIPIRFCGTARKWRDEQINHQQGVDLDQRRLLLPGG